MHRSLLFCLVLFLAAMGCSKPAVGGGGMDVGANYIGVEIHADRDCVKAGEVVKLRAVATNRGKTTAVISLEDRPVLDIRIAYSTNPGTMEPNVFQYWSDGRELTAEDKRLELAPGESKSIEMDWVAEHGSGRSSQIELWGLLQYGERESDVAVGRTFLSVDTCPF